MKKLICLVFVFAIMLTACAKWEVEIVDPTKPVESKAEIVVSEEGEQQSEVTEETNNTEESSESSEEAEEEPLNVEDFIIGDAVLLETSGDAIYEALEFEDRIVVYYVFGNIAAFDIKTGEKLYEFSLGDVNKVGAFDMMKNISKEGFDYSVSMINKIVYLSSKDPGLMDIYFLPENVMKSLYGDRDDYSVFGNKIIWISEEGIRMGNLDGSEEEILIPTGDIVKKIKPIAQKAYDEIYFVDDGEPCIFYEVSFICGGEKIAVTATSDKTFVYWSAALYDIESGEFEWAYNYSEMVNSDYPFGDRYITVAKKWIDAQTGNYKNFKIWPRSVDGINFIKSETDDRENHGLKIFCGDIDSIEEGGEKIFELKNFSGCIEAITENYILISIFRGESWDYCLVRYK